MKNKKFLLNLSEKIAHLSSQEAINCVLNLLYSVEEENGDKEELVKYIFIACKNKYVFGGFGSAQKSFIDLVNNILIIKKSNGKIKMCNKEYDALEFDEFKYVMNWARRVSISKKVNKTKRKDNNFKSVNVEKKQHIHQQDDSPFAVLKDYKFE